MDNLRELRTRAGLTQMQLAAACGVSLTSVIKWKTEPASRAMRTRRSWTKCLTFCHLPMNRSYKCHSSKMAIQK